MVDLGIETANLNDKQVQALEKSVAAAIKINENTKKYEVAQARASSSFPIQRRGQRLPGDVGNNFGLFSGGLHGDGNLGPFADTYPGSYGFSGMFGGGGGGTGYGSNPYLSYGQGSHTAFKRNTKLAHHKMSICVSTYKGFGLAKNVIDLMANFASEGLKIKHPVKGVERFLNRWAFHVNLQSRVKDIIRYYYKYGNVFVYRTVGEIDNTTYLKLKRSKASTLNKIPGREAVATQEDTLSDPQESERLKEADRESSKPIGKRRIPWRYTLLNPFQMELRGSKFFGGQRWVFVLDHNTVNEIRSGKLQEKYSYVDFLDESDVNLPPEFKRSSFNIDSSAPENEFNDPRIVDLEQNLLYTMHYMKDDHEDWADPLLWPVMKDIYYKNKLRQMDISVCDSVINAVTIFKLGDYKSGFVAPETHLAKFSEFLRAPTQAMQMVWNDAISIENSFPPVDKILGIAKYESVDRDILRGIGIPDTLIGGGGSSNFSTGFLGVRTLLERLEEGRNTVMRWILKELEVLIKTLGIRKMPTIKFGKMSLRDEKAEKQLILQLLDRNIISIEAVLEAFGEDFEIEIERLREENKFREETGLLQKHSPYVDPINDMDAGEQMEKESELKRQEQRLMTRMKQRENKAKKNASGPNGRPGNTDGIPQDNKRETKPQGMAWLMDFERAKGITLTHLNNVEKVVAKQILKALGKRTKRSLTKHESKGVEEIMFAIAAQSVGLKVNEEVVRKILENNPTIDGVIYSAYNDMRHEDMSLGERKEAMASAIAYCSLKEK